MNRMDSRALPCINLGPIGNLHGSHRFLNLRTGRIIKRNKWTEVPILPLVISRVEALTKNDNKKPALEFKNRAGHEKVDVVDDDDNITRKNYHENAVAGVEQDRAYDNHNAAIINDNDDDGAPLE